MFESQKFNIPEINGISKKTIEEHLKLYEGYIKHANLIESQIKELQNDPEKTYIIGELKRRLGFEFGGIRNHEYYFEQIENGPEKLNESSDLGKKIIETFGSIESWTEQFKKLCMTRGIGWAILCYDEKTKKLIHSWVDEQHIGHLNGLKFIYGIDMWEHSYMLDYVPSEKKKYIDSFFEATNFKIVEKRFN